jgi:hypothetical protein
MMRAVTTPAILGVLVTAMVAGGLPAGCSSRAIGHKGVDASASFPDAPAGGGGVAGSGGEAAAAGSGDNGGVTGSGGLSATAGATRTGGITEPEGGVTSSGGSSASGGSAGVGGTSVAGGIDASAEKPRPTEGTPCRSQDDCGALFVDSYLECHRPGESWGCGGCLMGDPTAPGNCWSDADCVPDGGATTGTMICDYPPSTRCCCSCPRMLCVLGCRTNNDCDSGQACNQSYRCEKACVAGDGTCPVDFSCDVNGACRRNSCTSDSECSAFCVMGSCYDTLGDCEGIRL